jgi:hypothetical protein
MYNTYMKIDTDRIYRAVKLLKNKDPLVKFTAEGEKTWLVRTQRKNLINITNSAKKYGLRYIYIGKGEISGCERIDQPNSPWPAIWAIRDETGLRHSCGNTDQSQTDDYDGVYFPPYAYGGWDLVEGRKLTDKETEEKKFRRVVTDKHYRRL